MLRSVLPLSLCFCECEKNFHLKTKIFSHSHPLQGMTEPDKGNLLRTEASYMLSVLAGHLFSQHCWQERAVHCPDVLGQKMCAHCVLHSICCMDILLKQYKDVLFGPLFIVFAFAQALSQSCLPATVPRSFVH